VLTVFRALRHWGGHSLAGHLVLSEVCIAIPLFLLGLIVNIRAGYPSADLALLIVLPLIVGLPPGLFIWYRFTNPRMKRNRIGVRNR
jgi:hypothetical protein